MSRLESRVRRIAAVVASGTLALSVLVAGPVSADQPMAAPQCALRLSVEVTPDVENPAAPGFISSLLGDNVQYRLFLLDRVDDTHVILQLQGPGEMPNCRAVVKSMRESSWVASIHED